MSETFTPGPWKVLRGVDDDETRCVVVAAGAGREYLIATVENGQPGDCLDTEVATAHLIAAAPMMHAAIAAFLEKWPAVNQAIGNAFALQFTRSQRQYTGPSISAEVEQLRAALQEADGVASVPADEGTT